MDKVKGGEGLEDFHHMIRGTEDITPISNTHNLYYTWCIMTFVCHVSHDENLPGLLPASLIAHGSKVTRYNLRGGSGEGWVFKGATLKRVYIRGLFFYSCNKQSAEVMHSSQLSCYLSKVSRLFPSFEGVSVHLETVCDSPVSYALWFQPTPPNPPTPNPTL